MSLVDLARQAAENSYSPYSEFAVGAAVQWADGTVTIGTNVENKSYGLTQCAERSAVTAGISQGLRDILAIAVWVGEACPVSPCGACRQVLSEFSSPENSLEVTLACPSGDRNANQRIGTYPARGAHELEERDVSR